MMETVEFFSMSIEESPQEILVNLISAIGAVKEELAAIRKVLEQESHVRIAEERERERQERLANS
jgi:hypothetical protein